MTYGTAGYVGEGILAFDLHCDQPEWRAWIEKAVQPNIEFLLKNSAPGRHVVKIARRPVGIARAGRAWSII